MPASQEEDEPDATLRHSLVEYPVHDTRPWEEALEPVKDEIAEDRGRDEHGAPPGVSASALRNPDISVNHYDAVEERRACPEASILALGADLEAVQTHVDKQSDEKTVEEALEHG